MVPGWDSPPGPTRGRPGFPSPTFLAVPEGEISIDDPRAEDVRELLERHLAFAHLHTPPEDIHALDVDGLVDPAVTFFSFRLEGSSSESER